MPRMRAVGTLSSFMLNFRNEILLVPEKPFAHLLIQESNFLGFSRKIYSGNAIRKPVTTPRSYGRLVRLNGVRNFFLVSHVTLASAAAEPLVTCVVQAIAEPDLAEARTA
jgi:hypothetical protein